MEKIINDKKWYLIFGIFQFLIFAYDIENDRDFWTWTWLLISQLNLMTYFYMLIVENKKENIKNITNSTVIIK